ncbi:MAG: hypothetical protein GY754_45315 [bacterium]|nr:hypothetical protein [bacterium]
MKKKDNNILAAKVIEVNPDHYRLPCSECGEIAASFKVGMMQFEKKKGLIYRGITHSKLLGLRHARKIFKWLKKGNISKVHYYVQKNELMEDGIDAYCPECDKIYCRKDYNVCEEWDEGYYDYAIGICPCGHKRILDK